jgi:PEGA domain-containing protein
MRVLLLFSLMLLTGCAAIFGSKQKTFDLRSDPGSAEVFLDGARLGTTPFKVQLSNMKEHTFVFRKEGYKEVTCTLTKQTGGGWVVADILLGIVPIIIDAATSSWSQTKGDSCMGSLEPMTAPVVAAAAPTPTVADAARVPATLVRAPPAQPVAGVDRLPAGTNYVGDLRIKRYYPLGCAAQHAIPAEAQVFFQTSGGADSDGFKPSGDC